MWRTRKTVPKVPCPSLRILSRCCSSNSAWEDAKAALSWALFILLPPLLPLSDLPDLGDLESKGEVEGEGEGEGEKTASLALRN
eukprot:CAMPEP_0173199436 /NCGR_PEP_ID=MMETSP1141-20130122/17235_1 /TAXON_ID=483371 /ORGANISM="non described non described, Strain CCMP2298" /LENGTH=83 /DNA_ID=CAMNT_0014124327 /DNA_START=158 /DNA_END=406 /DNA_ORIENTATION=+